MPSSNQAVLCILSFEVTQISGLPLKSIGIHVTPKVTAQLRVHSHFMHPVVFFHGSPSHRLVDCHQFIRTITFCTLSKGSVAQTD